MISHKLKFIFVHIPKTSGNSLSLYLKDIVNDGVIQRDNNLGKNSGIDIICEKTKTGIKHENIDYYRRIYGEKINDYFKFTIVRNPYDRMLSFYFFEKTIRNQTFNRSEFIRFVTKCKSFQYDYIDDSCHTIHYENLIDELKNIDCFKGVVDFEDYPKLNSSANCKELYHKVYDNDEELKNIIFEKFKKEFEMFGYAK